MKDTDKELTRLTRQRNRVEEELAEKATSGDHTELRALGDQLAELTAAVDRVEEQWLALAEEAEAAKG